MAGIENRRHYGFSCERESDGAVRDEAFSGDGKRITANICDAAITYCPYGCTMTARIRDSAYDIVLGEEVMKRLIKTSPLLKRCLVELYGGET